MSYCVEYNPELNKKYPTINKHRQRPTKKIVILLVIFVSAYIFVQSGFVRCLLPGNPDVTISAFSELVKRVGDGEPVKKAVVGFCEEIISNGH